MAVKRSAAETYRARLERARTMLATLSALLDQHEKEQAEHPRDWGYAGDLGHVNELLGDAAASLEETERV